MQPQDSRSNLLAHVAPGAAILAGTIGLLALIGWATGVSSLVELLSDAPQMKANTAIALVLLAGALWLVRDLERSDEERAWSRFLAEVAALIAGLTLAEYAFGFDLGIDGLFTDDSGDTNPGRMSVHTGATLLALGLWLSALDRSGRRWGMTVNALGALSALAVLSAVIGWLYGADYIAGKTDVSGVAPQTALGLTAIFAGTLTARPSNPWMRLVLGSGPAGHTMRRLIPAVIAIPILAGLLVIVGVEQGWFSTAVGSALAIAGAVIALLALLVYTSRELELADLERSGLQARLVELADRDPLTNVFNRRRLDEELRRQLAFSQRHGTPISVLSIDLDDFKAANDSYGHATGDELLMATAEALKEELRTSDFICRPGGDEFIVALPDSDEESARIVAGKLVRAFRGVQRPRPGGGVLQLRASIGIATSDTGGWLEPHDLLAAADRALYAAKQAGGDRFSVEAALVLDSAAATRT